MQVLASDMEKLPLNNIFMYSYIFDCVFIHEYADQRQPVFRDILPWTYEIHRFNSSMMSHNVAVSHNQ